MLNKDSTFVAPEDVTNAWITHVWVSEQDLKMYSYKKNALIL